MFSRGKETHHYAKWFQEDENNINQFFFKNIKIINIILIGKIFR